MIQAILTRASSVVSLVNLVAEHAVIMENSNHAEEISDR